MRFHEKISKLPDISSKNRENQKFPFTPIKKKSCDSSLGPSESCIEFYVFYVFPPPDAINLTDNRC